MPESQNTGTKEVSRRRTLIGNCTVNSKLEYQSRKRDGFSHGSNEAPKQIRLCRLGEN